MRGTLPEWATLAASQHRHAASKPPLSSSATRSTQSIVVYGVTATVGLCVRLWKAVVDVPCKLQRVVEDVGLLVYVYNAL